MNSAISKQLIGKIYEERRAAALNLEKQIRGCQHQGDRRRISQIIDQLIDMFSTNSNPSHIRNGGLIGLAATAVGLGADIVPYMEEFVGPLLSCFVASEHKIRYFSIECLYNIAKVTKSEVLFYFNDIFDGLIRLVSDPEPAVQNGAELLDRLLKDMVIESASVDKPAQSEPEKDQDARDILVTFPNDVTETDNSGMRNNFSLMQFIPLLRDRINTISSFTRSYLISWIIVLISVPEIKLIEHLQDFLDGLLKYLTDPVDYVCVAADGILGELLREIHAASLRRRPFDDAARYKSLSSVRVGTTDGQVSDLILGNSEWTVDNHPFFDVFTTVDGSGPNVDDRVSGIGIPDFLVTVDYDAIIEILIRQLDHEHAEAQQLAAVRWLTEFLDFVPHAVIPYTPRLVSGILPSLGHHVEALQFASIRLNTLLFSLIHNLPSLDEASPVSHATRSEHNESIVIIKPHNETDAFDYLAAVSSLTALFVDEHEEARLAALKWLMMLHQKAPKMILTIDGGAFPALLKTLTDSSEEVVEDDLQLLVQIVSNSEEVNFKTFLYHLLQLFNIDRRLLHARGSLIIRRLCLMLDTEKVYRAFAEILEEEEDLEFASLMVHKLNIVLLTYPEFAKLRKKLRNSLETPLGDKVLFITLYRPWCHNAATVISLCLLVQAYEHASDLLSIFVDLDITARMLIHIDQLVTLIESPVFAYLRLQLLEPEKYPQLFTCLYRLLMVLPQHSAFVSLHNRLSAVSSAGFWGIVATITTVPPFSAPQNNSDGVGWQDLLVHFQLMQTKHETARRQATEMHEFI